MIVCFLSLCYWERDPWLNYLYEIMVSSSCFDPLDSKHVVLLGSLCSRPLSTIASFSREKNTALRIPHIVLLRNAHITHLLLYLLNHFFCFWGLYSTSNIGTVLSSFSKTKCSPSLSVFKKTPSRSSAIGHLSSFAIVSSGHSNEQTSGAWGYQSFFL